VDRNKVRPAGVAGGFYPNSKMELERDLSLLLENSPFVETLQSIKAIIVPHAGYMYSGGVAARAYRQIIQDDYDFCVIIAPSHYEPFNFISIYPGKAFETPLGEIAVENRIVDLLVSGHPDIQLSEQGYSPKEHSLEVQLPLTKWVQDSPRIVPLMMGNQSLELINSAAEKLGTILKGENCIIIASTDLSHFHSDSKARAMDNIVINHINNFAPDRLYEDISEGRCEMCGYGPAIVAMKVAQAWGATHSEVLLYRNSGDMTGDTDKVVGYLSAIVY